MTPHRVTPGRQNLVDPVSLEAYLHFTRSGESTDGGSTHDIRSRAFLSSRIIRSVTSPRPRRSTSDNRRCLPSRGLFTPRLASRRNSPRRRPPSSRCDHNPEPATALCPNRRPNFKHEISAAPIPGVAPTTRCRGRSADRQEAPPIATATRTTSCPCHPHAPSLTDEP